MSKLLLYHGSPEIIQTPVFGKGKSYNDYGKGFYCTEHLELAKEWACTENTDGYANKYEIDTTGLSILNLSSDEYTILHWLALLMKYRIFRLSTPIMKRGTDWLKEHFLIDLTPVMFSRPTMLFILSALPVRMPPHARSFDSFSERLMMYLIFVLGIIVVWMAPSAMELLNGLGII